MWPVHGMWHARCMVCAIGTRTLVMQRGCAGYEPRRLFNVVQFVMNAPNGRATVTLEDAMQIMYLRYGRQMLDSQVPLISHHLIRAALAAFPALASMRPA